MAINLCNGEGWCVEAGCCGAGNIDGSCCGEAIPVQVECPGCDACDNYADEEMYDEDVLGPLEDDPYADFDDEYEGLANFEPIQKDGSPQGSLTDNLRHIKPRKEGAAKRARVAQRRMKEWRITRDDD